MGQILFYAIPEADETIKRFGGSLTKGDELKGGLKVGLPGLSASVEQTKKSEPKNTYEKVADLRNLLNDRGVLGKARPTNPQGEDSKEFLLESCRAVRVVVPENANQGKDSQPLSFWISPGDEDKGILCLLEGSGGDAANPYNFGRSSTYTLLQSLVYFARKQGRASLFDGRIPNDPHTNPNSRIDDTHPPSLIEQYQNFNRNGIAYDFCHDPLGLLESWGCDLAPGRDIEALYRIREYGGRCD